METFDCEKFPALHGTARPVDWGKMSVLHRMVWLEGHGAADPLEARDVLQALGEWPHVPLPSYSPSPPRRRLPEAGPSKRPAPVEAPREGRRDRLAKYT